MKIRIKLAAICAVASLCVTALAAGILYSWLWRDSLSSLSKNISLQLSHIDFSIKSLFSETESNVDFLLSLDSVRSRDDSGFTSFLGVDEKTFAYRIGPAEQRIIQAFNAMRLTHPNVNSVYMGRENGSFVRSHPRDRPTAYDPRDRPWYSTAKANPGKAALTEAYPSLTAKDVNIGVVKALLDEKGSFYGVLGMDITLARLTSYLGGFSFDPQGSLVLADGNGTILACADDEFLFRKLTDFSPELDRAFLANRPGLSPLRVRGEPAYVFTRSLGDNGWKAGVVIPAANITRKIDGPVSMLAIILLLGSAAIVGLVFLALTNVVIRPLRRFAAETTLIAETGNLNRRIGIKTKDEIGTLSAEFDEMLRLTMIAERELSEHRKQLELQVAERTASLEETNSRLSAEIESREKIALALSTSETLYRELVQGAKSTIMRFAPDGAISFMNEYGLEFFGFSRDELVGKNMVGTIVPETESGGGYQGALPRRVAENPEEYALHVNENVRKNGERVWMAWTNRPVAGDGGKPTEILSIGNDITKLVETEKSLRLALSQLEVEKDRAESANRLKSAFLATMSHELRTPLNSIIGFSGILAKGLSGPLNAEQEKQLGMVMGSARHLLALINDVLDISKIEAGQFTVVDEPMDPKAVVEKALLAARPLAEKKGIELRAEISPDLPPFSGDERRLGQVLLNLIGNAIKFTEKGWVSVNCRPKEGGLEVEVVDTGIGIKSEDKEALFQAFRQIDTGLTRKYEGTGLGLSISKKLVLLMGGDIWVRSEWGSGSAFGFSLPGKGKRR
jgi:PAS domain S-box-containing protein